MKTSRFTVIGMSCSACSSHVEKCVSKLKGVSKVSVNLLAGNMQVDYDETVMKDGDIVKAVKKAGYGAKSLEKKEAAKEAREERREEEYVTVSASSVEELMNKINDTIYAAMSDQVETKAERTIGHNIDFSV